MCSPVGHFFAVLYGDFVTHICHFETNQLCNYSAHPASQSTERWHQGQGKQNILSGPVEDHTFGAPKGNSRQRRRLSRSSNRPLIIWCLTKVIVTSVIRLSPNGRNRRWDNVANCRRRMLYGVFVTDSQDCHGYVNLTPVWPRVWST